MKEETKKRKEGKIKKFFSEMFGRLDKKIEEKANKQCGCSQPPKGGSCCS